jgi:hypothetical protein
VADLLRILVKTGALPFAVFQSDGGPADLDSGMPTVVATRPDGTTFSPALTASHVGAVGSGKYQVTYPPQTECTLTRLDWTGPVGGVSTTLTTWVEVVGASLFTIPDARAFKVAGSAPLNATAEADLLETRDSITDEFEAICGWSFIPRYRRDTFYGAWDQLVLDRLKVQRIISLTVDGVAFTAPQLADLAILPGSVLRRRTLGWFASTYTAATVVEYVHGWDRAPGAIKTAALKLAAAKLNPTALGSTVSSFSTPDGITYAFDPAGRRIGLGDVQHYGIPSVDSVLNRNEWNAGSLAVA